MRKTKFWAILLFVVLLASCKTPTNVSYFQDASYANELQLQSEQAFRLRPDDKINIVVNSKDPVLEALFNLTANGQRNVLGAASTPLTSAGKTINTNSSPIAYTISKAGTIDFPILGTISAEGMTRQELATHIKNQLISGNHVKDAIVTVEYVNMGISVIGEVSRPGRIDINKDHFTILDAISQAGDLTINGQRENVMVIRRVGDKQKTYFINMCSQRDMVESPAYYLQQDDVIYVTPNDRRKRESTVSANTVLTPSFWLSVVSVLTTITALLIR